MEKDFIVEKPFAKIEEVSVEKDNVNMFRFYCNLRGTGRDDAGYTLQIRTNGPINKNGSGKDRNMMANVSLSFGEIEDLYNYAKSQRVSKCKISV